MGGSCFCSPMSDHLLLLCCELSCCAWGAPATLTTFKRWPSLLPHIWNICLLEWGIRKATSLMAALFLVRNQRSEASAKDLARKLTCIVKSSQKRLVIAELQQKWSAFMLQLKLVAYFDPCCYLFYCWIADIFINHHHHLWNTSTHVVTGSTHIPFKSECAFLHWCFSLPLDLRTFSSAISCINPLTLNQKGKMCLYCPIMGTFAVYATARTSRE